MHDKNDDPHGSATARGANDDRFDHAAYLSHRVGDKCDTGASGVGGGPLNCGGGCANESPAAQWFLADRIAATRLVPGAQVTVNLRQVQPVDRFGRHAHVVGIRMNGVHRFTVTAGTNSAYSGYQQMAVWAAIVLEDVTGWQYLANVDGRLLIDDRWMRSFSAQVQGSTLPIDDMPADIAANVGASNIDQNVQIYWPLTRAYARGHEAILDSVPLAMLQARGDSAFTFNAPASLVGAPTNIVPGGFQGLTEVWLKIVYLDKMFIDRPFQVETYVDNNLSGNLQRCDRTTEYANVIGYPEDNGGQFLNDFGAGTFQVAGETIASSLTLAQQQTRTFDIIADDPRYEDMNPSIRSGGFLRNLFVVGPTPRKRESMAAGVVGYLWTSRTRTFTRFMHRSISCQVANRLAWGLAYAGPMGMLVGVDPMGDATMPHKMLPAIVGTK
jgi:hypothetical protein